MTESATLSIDEQPRLTRRIARLRQLALAFANEPDPTERGWAVMRSYDETRAEPMPIRRAKAVAAYLDAMSLDLDEGDLLAGRLIRGIPGHPGIYEGYGWVRAAHYPELSPNPRLLKGAPVSDEYRAFMAEWVERHVSAGQKLAALRPDETQRALAHGVFGAYGLDLVHRLPRYQLLLQYGVAGLRDQAVVHLDALDPMQAEDVGKGIFYRALIIVCDAMIRLGQRWGERLAALADEAPTPERRAELEQMAAICRRVPAGPPETFWEALQAVWLTLVVSQAESSGSAHSLGRLDQYLWPYYEADLEAGRLTRDEALERIMCLFLKCYRTFDFHHTTVGGLTPEGEDGTNDLSYLCLEAVERLRTPRDVAVRIHRHTPDAFVHKAADVARLGLGRPDFWNDDVTVAALHDAGFSIEDARDYAPIGCVELTIPGKCNSRTMGHALNLAKVLEVTLNGGRCQLSGQPLGLEQDADYASYEALHDAFRRQVAHLTRMALEEDVRAYYLQGRELPFPMLSLFTVGCMAAGRDVMDGGAQYNPAGVNLQGIANAADALAAIKQVVYEEGSLTLDDLRQALRDNYAGQEALRQRLISRVPKYGNDIDTVDRIASEEVEFYCDLIRAERTPEGGPYLPLLFGCTPAAVHTFGPRTGASADGRLSGEPLATSVNPTHGRERAGITAELKSVAGLNLHKAAGGVSFIVDLHPTAVDGEQGLEKLTQLLRAFFEMGGMEIGLNVLREEDLRKAQRQPERYGHLMVRVFGFSAPFVSLDPAIQEEVIQKTKHVS